MSDDLSGDMLAPSWPNLVFKGKGIKHDIGYCVKGCVPFEWNAWPEENILEY